MPYVAAIPAVIVLIIALNYLRGHVLPRWGPQWTKPFVVEHPPECSELPPEPAKRPKSGWAIALFLLSVVGFAAEIVQLLPPGLDVTAVILPVSWVGVLDPIQQPSLTRPGSCCACDRCQASEVMSYVNASVLSCSICSRIGTRN